MITIKASAPTTLPPTTRAGDECGVAVLLPMDAEPGGTAVVACDVVEALVVACSTDVEVVCDGSVVVVHDQKQWKTSGLFWHQRQPAVSHDERLVWETQFQFTVYVVLDAVVVCGSLVVEVVIDVFVVGVVDASCVVD